MLLCFTFPVDHIGNCVLIIGEGACTEIQAWKDFLCHLRFSGLVLREWGMELEDAWEGFL